jgi:flagellar basal-body rod protein FlgC
MDFLTTFKIAGQGLSVQRAKMDVITSNLANASTTRTPEGGPYHRKTVVLAAQPVEKPFAGSLKDALQGVQVKAVVEDGSPAKKIHDPTHPDADAKGFVAMPNVNVMLEMADMITASRTYEACVTAFDASKSMALKTLDIGK